MINEKESKSLERVKPKIANMLIKRPQITLLLLVCLVRPEAKGFKTLQIACSLGIRNTLRQNWIGTSDEKEWCKRVSIKTVTVNRLIIILIKDEVNII